MSRLAAFLVSLVLAFAALPAAAQIADTDRAAMQSAVTSQIDAFRRDDGRGAYAFASPSIQSLFPTVDIFMQMVQQGYMPVYRPQAFTFGPLVDSARGPKLDVFITGPDGAAYVAEYTFQRHPDGSWKINGVTLRKDNSPTI